MEVDTPSRECDYEPIPKQRLPRWPRVHSLAIRACNLGSGIGTMGIGVEQLSSIAQIRVATFVKTWNGTSNRLYQLQLPENQAVTEHSL